MSAFRSDYYDMTWNFFSGCDPVSDACKNCVAKKKIANLLSRAKKSKARYQNGFEFTVNDCDPPYLKPGSITYLVNNLSDTFHEKASFTFLARKFTRMIEMEQHEFIIVTKRPHRMAAFVDEYFGDALLEALNIIMGVSVERRENLDRLQILNQVQSRRCVFFEPLLEDIGAEPIDLDGIDRVYAGPEVMPFKKYPLMWYSRIRKQCEAAGIPFILTRPLSREGKFHGGNHRKKNNIPLNPPLVRNLE